MLKACSWVIPVCWELTDSYMYLMTNHWAHVAAVLWTTIICPVTVWDKCFRYSPWRCTASLSWRNLDWVPLPTHSNKTHLMQQTLWLLYNHDHVENVKVEAVTKCKNHLITFFPKALRLNITILQWGTCFDSSQVLVIKPPLCLLFLSLYYHTIHNGRNEMKILKHFILFDLKPIY